MQNPITDSVNEYLIRKPYENYKTQPDNKFR